MAYELWEAPLKSLGCLQILTALVVGIVTVFVFIFLKYAYRRHRISKILPGPKYGFFDVLGTISELEDRRKKSSHGNPNVAFVDMVTDYTKKYGKHNFFCTWMSYTPMVFFVKAEGLEEFLSGKKLLKKGWDYNYLHSWLSTGLLTSYGQKWKSRRRLLTPSFHFEILKDFLPIFNDNAQKLVKTLLKETKKDFIDIVKHVTLCTMDIICETTLGVEVNAQENGDSEYVNTLQRVSTSITERITSGGNIFYDMIFPFTKEGKQLNKDIKLLHDFTDRIIQEKKQKLLSGDVSALAKKRKALMDVLLEHHVQTKELSEKDIREEVDTFAFEGHDTTSMGISWALYLIGLHKDVQDKLYEEMYRIFGDDTERPVTTDDLKDMTYLDLVLKECQRLYPSVAAFSREASEDVEICGYKIPTGTICVILSYIVHRNPDVFPDPEKFDPDRFLPENSTGRHPYAYIPFSAGQRNCIGQRFAIMEEKVVVATVLRNFIVESLDSRDKVIPLLEIVLRSIDPIRIKLIPRSSI